MSGHASSHPALPYGDMGDGPVALLVFLPRAGNGRALTTNNGRMNVAGTAAARARSASPWRWLHRMGLFTRRRRA